MSFCNQCGTELPAGAKFCANCGAATTGVAPAGGPATPAAPTGAPGYAAAPDPNPGSPPTGDRPASFRQPLPPQPVTAGAGGGGLGWVLPALVVLAAIVIGYLLLVPKGTTPATEASQAAAGTGADDDGPRTRNADDASPSDRRSVDAASDAATIASANTRDIGSGDAGNGDIANSVSAATLDAAFNSDPAGAAMRYAGPIRVSGTIASMVQPGSTPSLSMEGRTRFNFMIVNFPAGYRERLAPLSKGQFISVACDEVRTLGGTTILSGCLLR